MKKYVFDQKFSFENFLYNQKNAYAVLTAKEISNLEGQETNPFIISGEAGSGKSHLLKAMANTYVEKRWEDILLVGLEELHLHLHRETNNGAQLTKRIASFEVIMIDDFQLVQRYPRLQGVLAPCLKEFLAEGKQIVLACTGRLLDLDSLPREMQSRLQSGITVNLKRPDLDVRLEFLRKHNAKNQLGLTENDLFEIATSCIDFKKIYGVIYNLLFYSEFGQRDSDLQEIMSTKLKEVARPVNIQTIQQAVADYFQLVPEDLVSGRKKRDLVFARQIAMTLCRELLGLTYAQIGAEFGNANHSLALYSVKKIKKLQSENQDVNQMLNELKTICRI